MNLKRTQHENATKEPITDVKDTKLAPVSTHKPEHAKFDAVKPETKKPAHADNKQAIAEYISEYAKLDTTSDRLKFIQKLMTKPNSDSVINKLAYVFADTAKTDLDDFVAKLSQSKTALANIKPQVSRLEDSNDITKNFIVFNDGFHLLGRNDDRDAFKIQLRWNFLSNTLQVVQHADTKQANETLNALNSIIDGHSAQNAGSTLTKEQLEAKIDEDSGVVDLLTDLLSGDNKKIKEARRYEDDFLNGKRLVQSLHERGTYEEMASIKKRAFRNADEVDGADFIDELRQIDNNKVDDGGFLKSSKRELTREEAIKRLFDNQLDVDSVLAEYKQDLTKSRKIWQDRQDNAASLSVNEAAAVDLIIKTEKNLIDALQGNLQAGLDKLAHDGYLTEIKLKLDNDKLF